MLEHPQPRRAATRSWPRRPWSSELPPPLRKIIGDLSDRHKVSAARARPRARRRHAGGPAMTIREAAVGSKLPDRHPGLRPDRQRRPAARAHHAGRRHRRQRQDHLRRAVPGRRACASTARAGRLRHLRGVARATSARNMRRLRLGHRRPGRRRAECAVRRRLAPARARSRGRGAYDSRRLLARIENAVRSVGATRVILDSLGAIFPQFADAAASSAASCSASPPACARLGVTAMITAERTEEYGDDRRATASRSSSPTT